MFDINKIRNDFPMLKNHPEMIYFDNGATSFKPQVVIDAIKEYYENYNSNIHRGDYDLSFKTSKIYDDIRKDVANFIGAKDPNSIVYTAGDTASLNIVAYGLSNKLNKGDTILTTKIEHASSVLPWFKVAQFKELNIEFIPLNEDGTFNLNNFEELFKNNKNIKVVALTHVSNILGYINPIKEICEIAHKYNAIVVVDGAQSVPHIKINVEDLDLDFLTFSSHKMLGPEGLGILYGKYELLNALDYYFLGGGSNARFNSHFDLIMKNAPEKFESGTPNIASVFAFKKAIEYLNELDLNKVAERELSLAKYFVSKLKELDNVIIYNPNVETGIVAFNIKDIFSQDAASYFNSKGIAVRTGNHCVKMIDEILGVNDTIRASFAFYNKEEEIDKFIDIIKETTIDKCIGAVI